MTEPSENSELTFVGKRIRTAREEAGLTQQELALLCGISTSALSLIETGKRDLRISSLFRIAVALRESASALLAEADDQKAGPNCPAAGGYDLGDYT